jgi:hypothetical protein
MTLDHVVIARDRYSLESTRDHERVHVRQCEVWGPLFVPAPTLRPVSGRYYAAAISTSTTGSRSGPSKRARVGAET